MTNLEKIVVKKLYLKNGALKRAFSVEFKNSRSFNFYFLDWKFFKQLQFSSYHIDKLLFSVFNDSALIYANRLKSFDFARKKSH